MCSLCPRTPVHDLSGLYSSLNLAQPFKAGTRDGMLTSVASATAEISAHQHHPSLTRRPKSRALHPALKGRAKFRWSLRDLTYWSFQLIGFGL
jgi:hypothetical protein